MSDHFTTMRSKGLITVKKQRELLSRITRKVPVDIRNLYIFWGKFIHFLL